MTRLQYIIKSFIHYFKANLLVALGVIVSTMVLTGSLIIGDSVRYSLTQSAFYRLGETTHLVSVVERYFRMEMAAEIENKNPNIKATPVLLLEGMAVADGGEFRANRVQIIGIDADFEKISNTTVFSELQNNEIAISENLAERLQKGEGDNILVRIKKASLIPMNAPFVSADETSVALRATIKKVVSKEELGRFNLKNSQTAPYNIFVSIDRLNRLMDFSGKANHLLISTPLETATILENVNNSLLPADAGLSIKSIESSNEVEISTDRVFMEEKIAETLLKLQNANPVLTYFVNEIANLTSSDTLQIPYSFVSSINNLALSANEIVLNQWAATDLNAGIGDKIRLQYFEIGPLRKLITGEDEFIVKDIISMNSPLADSTLVPHLPGLSDAGHCREWEAGVPINLDDIRDKDEKYWDDYKGTPKAFISSQKALSIWSNRFGNYTAVRYPANDFEEEKFKKAFAAEILPKDLGMAVEPIRKQGIEAAQNGTDFSGLFIGLSFFLLLASIILTALLFRFNIENRSSQVGLLMALGFNQKLIRNFFLWEGLAIAVFGGLIGLLFSYFYSIGVFKILNSLWFDIVRTNVLEIKILPFTLLTGFVISIFVSVFAILITIRRFEKQKTVGLQKQSASKTSKSKKSFYTLLIVAFFVLSIGILVIQVLSNQSNPALFFASGGLLLPAFLMLFRNVITIRKPHTSGFSLANLSFVNLTRNKSRSLTIVILFALGTFIVVSTGSNKLDLFANAQEKSSGTGGFTFFAQTTMPVLFDINNEQKRAEEGLVENFNAVQFRKIDGDDASCLNLNRISQPAILGVDPEQLENRFSFAASLKEIEKNRWLALNERFSDGTVPAIADQTVIQWGLGKKIGDVLLYQNEFGDTLRLKLIAGTKPSIFQGFIIISNQHFLANFPSTSGSNVFLIEGNSENKSAVNDELQSVFRDYGWEMENTAKRLVEFYSVTNTYLSIFLALGALGLILGTIGLAIILARTILERRREIALMKAVGFSEKSLFIMLSKEYAILLSAGVLIGFIAAVVATLPAFLSNNSDASFSTVLWIVLLILFNGFIWIFGLSWLSLRKKEIISGLRTE